MSSRYTVGSAPMKSGSQKWGDSLERSEHVATAKRSFQRVARNSSRARASNGLVIASYLAVRRQGRLIQLCLPGMPPVQEIAKRGKCDGMSEESQRRLLIMLHSIRRDADLPTMVTLTFPEEVKLSPAEAKRCLAAWEKRVRRRYPMWCAIWRMEAHPKMSARLGRVHPHFHLLTWGAWYDLAWVSEAWTEAVWSVLEVDAGLECSPAENDGYGMCLTVKEKHQRAGTNCEKVRKWAGVIYCAKTYLAKDEEFPMGEAGRVWGYANRSALPLAEEERIPLTAFEAICVRLEVEEWMRERRIVSEHLICTFFEEDPTMFLARLMRKLPLMDQERQWPLPI